MSAAKKSGAKRAGPAARSYPGPVAETHARRGGKAGGGRPQRHRREERGPARIDVVGHAETLLATLLTFERPADAVVSAYFKANPSLGHRDRGLVAEAVYAVLRRKLEYAQLAQSGSGPLNRRMVLLGLADTAGVEPVAATLEAEERTWLRRVATVDRSSLPFATRTNLPPWLLERLRTRFDDVAIGAIVSALNAPAPLDLRVNSMRTTRYDALAALRTAGLEADATPFAPNGIRLRGKPALAAQQIFADGRV